jgi:predicted DNA-binding protein
LDGGGFGLMLGGLEIAMTLTVEIDADTERRLKALSDRTGLSEVEHVAQILKYGLEEVEDYYRASAIAERIRDGKEKTYPLEDVMRELGLEN